MKYAIPALTDTTSSNAVTLANQSIRASSWALVLLASLLLGSLSLPSLADDQQRININTATPEELAEALTGVGMAKAYRIVEYREAHGPFEVVDELAEVRGIGDTTVEINRVQISLE